MKTALLVGIILLFLFTPAGLSQSFSKDGRFLSIDVNEAADTDYDAAFQIALDAGMQATSFSLQWDMIETEPYTYTDPYGFLEVANIYYPAYDIPLNLMIGPIDTVANRMPEDLRDKPFNDSEVIQRYYQMILFVFDKIPDVELVSFSIGNEIDIYLETEQQWDAYIEFFNQTKQLIMPHLPDVPIGTKATLTGYLSSDADQLDEINQLTDAVFVTYYPLKGNYDVKSPYVVFDDFDAITSLFPDRDIYFHEVGYPSSPMIDSSEEKQAQFIINLFDAWEEHADQIRMINIVWLHDVSQDALDEFELYYGSSHPGFLAYLGSLGVRHHEGPAKNAYIVLKNITNPAQGPIKPLRPTGPQEGIIGTTYTFTTQATDPDGGMLWYQWDYGNGVFSEWDGPSASDVLVNTTYTWSEKGSYNIRVHARNEQDVESPWSEPLSLSMPKTKLSIFLSLLKTHNPVVYHLLMMLL